MGSKNCMLSREQLDEYFELTYLSKFEILLILDKLNTLRRDGNSDLLIERFPIDDVVGVFPQLKYNPFRDRLVTVFSSAQDDCYSFEDLLDLFSVLSEKFPLKVKAAWAFRLYDFDGDNFITKVDIMTLCDRITSNDRLQDSEKEIVTTAILSEIDLQNNGSLGEFDFIHAMQKIPEFLSKNTNTHKDRGSQFDPQLKTFEIDGESDVRSHKNERSHSGDVVLVRADNSEPMARFQALKMQL